MSATFKNAKKLAQQEQLRKLMKEHKKILKEPKKIDSPLAKYNDLGQLTCILCKSIVRSDAVWTVHINAKQHKQNIEIAKKLKEKTNNFTTPLKRPLTPPLPDVPEKKIKGILKNAPPTSLKTVSSTEAPIPSKEKDGTSGNNSLATKAIPQEKTVEPGQNKEVNEELAGELPEGFFDDPVLDAKARNLEYKDPLEMEWEKFMKEMKVVEDESEAIIAGDQDEATADRHIEEIDEQIVLLNKVLDLEKKKDVAVELLNKLKSEPRTEDEEIDEDIDEFLDWRQKKAF
ncbi:zinc finger protein 830 [Anthonomus grandis grandis]|uniref:zinc finger protein 830 n=1 Tax=Anthonomus grandis grandis TaxID=2921223 RepID=UPI002166B3BB|nr:zinc finger protein 830 [Anthonomus grandis grandis]